MSRILKQSSAQIDLSKIVGDKRVYDFTEEDKENLEGIILECSNTPIVLKNQKKKKKKKKKEPENLNVNSIIKDLGDMFMDKKEEKKEESKLTVSGWSFPEIKDNGFVWDTSCILPPYIEIMCKVFQQLFRTIKIEDVSGKIISLYPPSKTQNITTIIPSANHGTSCRIIAFLGSCELITFNVTSGKTNASADLFMSKDQALMLGFGICSTVNIEFNNNTSFIYKLNTNSRGISKKKNPYERWVLVIDYISSENTIMKEFKNEAAKQSKGNSKIQQEIEDKIGILRKDVSIAIDDAKEKSKN